MTVRNEISGKNKDWSETHDCTEPCESNTLECDLGLTGLRQMKVAKIAKMTMKFPGQYIRRFRDHMSGWQVNRKDPTPCSQ